MACIPGSYGYFSTIRDFYAGAGDQGPGLTLRAGTLPTEPSPQPSYASWWWQIITHIHALFVLFV